MTSRAGITQRNCQKNMDSVGVVGSGFVKVVNDVILMAV
jgi:hypothetical protein